jgi:hypothetical protein
VSAVGKRRLERRTLELSKVEVGCHCICLVFNNFAILSILPCLSTSGVSLRVALAPTGERVL